MDTIPVNHAQLATFLNDYKLLTALLTLAFSLVATLIVMPRVILISKKKRLVAHTNERTSHKGLVPTLGGIGVFTGLMLTVNVAAILFANFNQLLNLSIFNILILLLLLVGVSDDLMNTAPRRKFYYQLGIALVFVFGTNIHIDSFSGLFGIGEIPLVLAAAFSAFVIVLIINAYNLIDGIDGLAGVLGMIISGFMALVFFFSDHLFYCLTSLSLVGALLGFLFYNFSNHHKIFLGDTGSMVVGFVLAYQVVLYLSLSAMSPGLGVFKIAPVFVLALLSYPLFDTLRVMIVRISEKRSPFSADRNHIHHRLLDLGLSHKFSTLLIGIYTMLVSLLAILINNLPINLAFGILVLVVLSLLSLPFVVRLENGKLRLGRPKLK